MTPKSGVLSGAEFTNFRGTILTRCDGNLYLDTNLHQPAGDLQYYPNMHVHAITEV